MQSSSIKPPFSRRDDKGNKEDFLESLLPVKDPYSSDDDKNCENEKDKDNRTKSTKRRREEKQVKLLKQSSELSAADVLLFFDLDYYQIPSYPQDFTQSTVEEILEALLRFSSIDKNEKEYEFKVYGKTVPELYRETLKKCSFLLWMKENDDLNFKTCTLEDILKKNQDFKSHRKPNKELLEELERDQTFAVMDFTETIMNQYKKNGLTDHDLAKSIFQSLGYLLPRGCFIKLSGVANYRMRYFVSEELVSNQLPSLVNKACPEVDRDCFIGVHPDAVFIVNEIDKIALQVFAPQEGSSSNTLQHKKITLSSEQISEHFQLKPAREKDAIFKPDYTIAAENYLKQFAPKYCKESATLNKLFGQHVVELITLAVKSMGKIQNRSRKDILGIFIKNEYIFLTKLVINDSKLLSYYPLIETYEMRFVSSDEIGEFSVADWCLDLTQANHRLAFVTFLVLYCKMSQLELLR